MTQSEALPVIATRKYPQMTADESNIARAWLLQHWQELDRIDFNHQLGNSVEIPDGTDEATRRQAEASSKKRADLIAWHGDEATIVEVKPRLYLAALGQLLGYQLLFHLEHPEVKTVHLVAIARDATPDAKELLIAHGVHVELFPNVPRTV